MLKLQTWLIVPPEREDEMKCCKGKTFYFIYSSAAPLLVTGPPNDAGKMTPPI
jgi:hypothetical protein